MRALPLLALLAFAPLASAQTLAPACPSEVSAHANADGSITLTWADVPQAIGYRVHREVGDGPWQYG
ncbi:MAG: hypothetical protein QOE90_2078 [Thermoplasmata archaeon]|jgi:hypothetical protein|nr:hypothetical protein [Thermoplasmata archaeon]